MRETVISGVRSSLEVLYFMAVSPQTVPLSRTHPPNAPTSRRQLLQLATREAHQRLEDEIERRDFFGARGRYAEYLARFHAMHVLLAAKVTAWIPDELRSFCSFDDRIAWLEDDLDALGRSSIDPRSDDETLAPEIDDASGALGVLYVMVGGALGARVLIERTESIALPEPRGRTFLRNVVETNWRAFVTSLEQHEPVVHAHLVRGAMSTFDCAFRHMTRRIEIEEPCDE